MTSQTAPILACMEEYFSSKHATLSFIPFEKIAVCTANAAYIPMDEFQHVFETAARLVKEQSITKFIFDKRNLVAFHQPSMEWYHLVWKEEMYRYGLRSYRKLLPADKNFENNVLAGKKKITRENPDFNFDKFDIIYCKTLAEALEK